MGILLLYNRCLYLSVLLYFSVYLLVIDNNNELFDFVPTLLCIDDVMYRVKLSFNCITVSQISGRERSFSENLAMMMMMMMFSCFIELLQCRSVSFSRPTAHVSSFASHQTSRKCWF